MNCLPRPELKRFLAGALDTADAAVLAAHVEDCSACQEVLDALVKAPSPARAASLSGEGEQDPTPELLDQLWLALSETAELRPAPRRSAGSTPVWPQVPPVEALGPLAVPGYEILSELNCGGMGIVYRARQLGLNRLVALKMVLAGAQASEADRARFRAEAEAVARLQHPNIVQIYEVGAHGGRPYFSMELVRGPTLARVCRGRPQSPAAAAALVETLARAIHCAHLEGIVHRDLKPANVLLQAEEGATPGDGDTLASMAPGAAPLVPKIIDFGLAKRLGDVGLTQHGMILGTPSYMAPEQVLVKSGAM